MRHPYFRTCRSLAAEQKLSFLRLPHKVPECGVALVNSLKTQDASDFPNTITTPVKQCLPARLTAAKHAAGLPLPPASPGTWRAEK